jgi:FlaG/FlaF family flagellin (archaellin)
MKRVIAMVVVTLCVAAAAQAAVITAVYEEITYPTPTTWRLFLTETTNWDGIVADMTPGGFGIAGFNVDLTGVTTAGKAGVTAASATLNGLNPNYDPDNDPPSAQWQLYGTVGFPNGASPATVDGSGNASAFAGQDTSKAMVVCHGIGVSAGSYVLTDTDNYQLVGSYSWTAPGAPGSASPGVQVFSGKRVSGATVSVVWSDRDQANVFNDGTSVNTTTMPVVPEPATMALLVLGALSALRRRR